MDSNDPKPPTDLAEQMTVELSGTGVRFLLGHIDSMTEDDIARMAERLGKPVDEIRLAVLGLKAKLALVALGELQEPEGADR